MSARQKIADLLWWQVPSANDAEAKAGAEEMLDAYRAEVLAEVTAWLVKKAREFRALGTRQGQTQADTAAALASKISRGAVRPNNVRMLPDAGFFETDHTYTREHHEQTIRFVVSAVSVSPDGRHTIAHGWRTGLDSDWEPTDSDDMDGWTDVTEEAAP